MAVAQIKRPRDFTFPASREAMEKMLGRLSVDELTQVLNEIIEALAASRDRDDLLPVRVVFEAWYRTTLLRQDPDHDLLTREAHDRAAGHIPDGVTTQTVDELRDEIGRRRAS
jgi:urocanate hydratase